MSTAQAKLNPDGSLVEGAGEYVVTGLEGPGFYDTQDTMPSTIYWFPDDVNGIQMWTTPGLRSIKYLHYILRK